MVPRARTGASHHRAKALDALAWVAYNQNDVDRLEALAAEGLALGDEAEVEGSRRAAFQQMMGDVARKRGDYERARKVFEEGLTLSRKMGDRRAIAIALGDLANLWHDMGNHARAKALFEESIALCREMGGADPLTANLINLGYMDLLEGDTESAAALNEEAAALLRERGNWANLSYAVDNLGWVALTRGDHERAKALYKDSLGLSREAGVRLIAAESLEGLACVAVAQGEYERATRTFGAAWALREAIGFSHTPEDRTLREPYLTDVRSRIEEASWEAAFAEGRAMTFEEAVEYAHSEEESNPSARSISPVSTNDEPVSALTRREREVANLVARGLTNRQVARELSISERTAANHVAKILRRLRLSSRTQLGALVVEDRPRAPDQN